jgi:hypothetical protein
MDEKTGAGGFSEDERAALRQRAAELKKEASRPRGGKAAAEELDVLTKISEMAAADRAVAERIHQIVTTAAPDLAPKLWYGQPPTLGAARSCASSAVAPRTANGIPPSASPHGPVLTTRSVSGPPRMPSRN